MLYPGVVRRRCSLTDQSAGALTPGWGCCQLLYVVCVAGTFRGWHVQLHGRSSAGLLHLCGASATHWARWCCWCLQHPCTPPPHGKIQGVVMPSVVNGHMLFLPMLCVDRRCRSSMMLPPWFAWHSTSVPVPAPHHWPLAAHLYSMLCQGRVAAPYASMPLLTPPRACLPGWRAKWLRGFPLRCALVGCWGQVLIGWWYR